MSWKFVYNPNATSAFNLPFDETLEKAKAAGYKFFMWNGQVRTISGEDTGITERDMF